jgi:hypothetical protein
MKVEALEWNSISLHVAGPVVGADVRRLVNELKRLAGVLAVVRGETVPRLLRIDYDLRLNAAGTLLAFVQRRWRQARLVSAGVASSRRVAAPGAPSAHAVSANAAHLVAKPRWFDRPQVIQLLVTGVRAP